MTMTKSTVMFFVLSAMVTPIVLAGGGPSRPPDKGEETFYTQPALFSTRPSSRTTFVQTIDRFGPVGIGIELHPPAFAMKVKNVEEGSPAATTGKLKAGQIIETINGRKLKDIDPRIQLGKIIAAAEATDGKVTLAVRDDEKAPVQKVAVSIPILGAYSETWPLDCKKSDKIVRDLADRLIEEGWSGSIDLNGPRMLFLLSTGEESDLDVVRGWIKKSINKNQNFGEKNYAYQWFTSWGGPCLAEYYLRTGDETVLPMLKKIADAVRKTMYHDAWAGRGVAAHHMGHAGTGTLTFLLLARQCGVEVEEGMLGAALTHFYRFAGRGVNPYMDAYPESGFTDNGRNGRLAFAMAAAAALDPKNEDSVYARARDIAAMSSFYSGTYMNHGHTGGGIGEVWRTAAMGLMYDKKPNQYREFMNERAWWYDISRRYNGFFGVLGGGSYDGKGVSWNGPTMGLTYTAPRKKLCIFGAPRSKYAKKYKIPARPWGTAADDAFLSLDSAPDKDGKVVSTDDEKFSECSGVPMNSKLWAPEMSDEELLKYARHPQPVYRVTAARRIYGEMRVHLIPDLLGDKDARVRYVGVRAMQMPIVSRRPEKCDPGFPQDKVTEEILNLLFDMLNDKNESWYVTDYVVKVLGRRSAEELAPHVNRLASLLSHEEQWIRHSALTALVSLAVEKSTYKKVMAAMENEVPNFIRSPRGLNDVAKRLASADSKLQKAGVEMLGKIYQRYPGKNANPPGGLHPQGLSERNYLTTVASALQITPGGLDMLYEVSKKRFPDQLLPYRDLFLGAENIESSPKMQKAIEGIVGEELIPEFVGRNWPVLTRGAQGGPVGGWRDPIDQLVALYKKSGVTGYEWSAFGTDRHDNEWEYFSFDPPEKVKLTNERANRYRPVTYPKGMEQWYAKEFDAKAAGWKKGIAPISNFDGKTTEGKEGCSGPESHCGCGDAGKTLWEKEVILMRRTFDLAPLKEGYRYRLLVGGASHVGKGDGYRVYINGKQITEAERYGGRGSGGQPDGVGIAPEFVDEFKGGKVVVAATSFLRQHHRSHKSEGHMNLWFQQQKIPPFDESMVIKSATLIPMVCTEWQNLQDPSKTITDPDEGKFWYDGKFKLNKQILGDWAAIGMVAGIDQFKPGEKLDKKGIPFGKLTFKNDGSTSSLDYLWSGDMVMFLARDYRGGAAYQALRMLTKTIDGADYLFVEAGGFSTKHPADWETLWVVLKK